MNVNSENTTAVTGQETSEKTQRMEAMFIEDQLEFERRKEAYKQNLETMMKQM